MDDWMTKLERAQALFVAGGLTAEEFESEKARLLPRSAKREAVATDDMESGYRPSGLSRSVKICIATVVAIAIGSAALMLGGAFSSESNTGSTVQKARRGLDDGVGKEGRRPEPQAPLAPPVASERKADTATDRAEAKSALADSGFQCVGAYSDVTFSEESGDGSGLFIRVRSDGGITFNSWEGGVFVGKVRTLASSPNRMSVAVHFEEFPADASSVTLICQDGHLKVVSEPWGSPILKRLSDRQAAELES